MVTRKAISQLMHQALPDKKQVSIMMTFMSITSARKKAQ